MRPTSGLTFGGRYQLSSRVAIGGMGEVWQATDLVIGRTVALKILKDEYLGDPGFLERFRAEARHAALVNHEGIANVFDYGEEDGSAYLVMELVPGEALSTMIEREHTLPVDKVLDIVAQTANALQAAHAVGLVHRDIKPGNLLITPDGRVKITDFGIARIADQVPLTATGQVMGTVQYLSPEQASGHPASPSTDIYSLGIVAYECLAGRRPFTGESQVAIAMAHINEQPPALPGDVPEPVAALVISCIAKKPADRPATAANLARAAQALRRGDVAAATVAVPALGGAGTVAFNPPRGNDAATALIGTQAGSTVGGGPRTPSSPVTDEDDSPKKRRAWIWWVVALGVIIIAGAVIAAFAFANQADEPTPSPSRSSAAPKPTRTSTPSPTQERLFVNQSDYVGRSTTEAQAALRNLGFEVTVEDGDAAPSADQANTVQSITPTGSVAEGTLITLRSYTAPPTVNKPNTPSAGPVSSDGAVTFTWTDATCPTGYTVKEYAWSVTGGKDSSGATSGTTSSKAVDVQADAAGQAVSFVYNVTCGNLTASENSDPASATWEAPVETETPSPDPTPSATDGPQDSL
ncbi:serine/threonine protein kinase [Curtobacterium sp. MMLR14_010]|uniref:serine/threonine-protein kinase n=1 Tax=Curtobacterium sp. MMLR14_010 TaxID=1898743 RepID=UPI0008DD1E57|nr:serine/threonine-protein kinase [Curtobacterium sp. MMLR14_010]OII31633.1 serine/threonine protein kinase [Curtobacterium sp. MMLR14_010]